MTGIRTSGVYRYEDKFGKEDKSAPILLFGEISSSNFTSKNNYQNLTSIGTKFRTSEVEGKFGGTFTINTILNYATLEMLRMMFEEYKCEDLGTGMYRHTYTKVNGKRPPSFTYIEKTLNRMTGGDEVEDITCAYLGCVAHTMNFTQDSSGATVGVTISGNYAWQRDDYGDLDETDWRPYDSDPVLWNCMEIDGEKIANVETFGFGAQNSAQMIYSTCSRKASNYYEQGVTFTANATVYSDNPSVFRKRVYSGGDTNDETEPRIKGLKPINVMKFVSDGVNGTKCTATLEHVTVDGMPRNIKTNTKLIDAPTLSPRNLTLEFECMRGRLFPVAPVITSDVLSLGPAVDPYGLYVFTLTADTFGETATWELVDGTLPSGATFGSNGNISGMNVAYSGTYEITVKVTTAGGSDTKTVTLSFD